MVPDEKLKEKVKKLQINMSKKAFKELEELRIQTDAPTKTHVVKSSLKLFKYLEDEKKSGATIIIKDKDGNKKELVLF